MGVLSRVKVTVQVCLSIMPPLWAALTSVEQLAAVCFLSYQVNMSEMVLFPPLRWLTTLAQNIVQCW